MNEDITQIDKIVSKADTASELIWVPGLEMGITRKSGSTGLLYYHPDGRRIKEAAAIMRLNALAIPPAYTDVIISINPFSHLQAIGNDARGRRQYRYHPDWHAERGKVKFQRLVDLEAGSLWIAAGYGALLGLAAYGTYDITNLSTLKNWPVSLSIVDMIWGTVLTGSASACGYAVTRHFA